MSTIDIPDAWSGEEALLVVAFLEDVVHAIWNRHHREMGLLLERPHITDDPYTSTEGSQDEDPDFGDQVIPF
jgi:hypothetical protein